MRPSSCFRLSCSSFKSTVIPGQVMAAISIVEIQIRISDSRLWGLASPPWLRVGCNSNYALDQRLNTAVRHPWTVLLQDIIFYDCPDADCSIALPLILLVGFLFSFSTTIIFIVLRVIIEPASARHVLLSVSVMLIRVLPTSGWNRHFHPFRYQWTGYYHNDKRHRHAPYRQYSVQPHEADPKCQLAYALAEDWDIEVRHRSTAAIPSVLLSMGLTINNIYDQRS